MSRSKRAEDNALPAEGPNATGSYTGPLLMSGARATRSRTRLTLRRRSSTCLHDEIEDARAEVEDASTEPPVRSGLDPDLSRVQRRRLMTRCAALSYNDGASALICRFGGKSFN